MCLFSCFRIVNATFLVIITVKFFVAAASISLTLLKFLAILINASRGGIIDEDAAYEALKSGKLGGLGLDAFEEEPPKNSKLLELDNVIATPHTGAHTQEATENMANLSVKNLIDVLSGKECPFIVNK